MRILFVFSDQTVLRHLDDVMKYLLKKNNHIILITNIDKITSHKNLKFKNIKSLKNFKKFQSLPLEIDETNFRFRYRIFREIFNWSNYFRSGHPSKKLNERWRKYLPEIVWFFINFNFIGKILSTKFFRKIFRLIEDLKKIDLVVLKQIQCIKPDMIFCCPTILPSSKEIEFLKVAKKLKITSVSFIQSWDNLSTKGTFSIFPDYVFVWNKYLKKEAIELHDIPKNIIKITGAPTYDFWFDNKMYKSVKNNSINKIMPFVTYLGSSRGMIENEEVFVEQLLKYMKKNNKTANLKLLIRPHPLNKINWKKLKSKQCLIWPINGEDTSTDIGKKNFYNTINYCSMVIGINTSGMIETSILNKPCITILDKNYKSSIGLNPQIDLGHFKHLTNGNFIYQAGNYEHAVTIMERILAKKDTLQKNREKFVSNFIRPRGIKENVSNIIANDIINILNKKNENIK